MNREWPERAKPWEAPVLFTLVAAFLLREAVFLGRVLYWRDVGSVWLPQTEAIARSLAENAWPVWDRWAGFGRPLFADPRAALLYPPTWLGVLVPDGRGYALFVLLHFAAAGLGAALLCRRLGASPRAALLAGLLYEVSGPLVSLGLAWHHLAGAAVLPWTLGMTAAVLTQPSRRNLAALALAAAAQVLAGSPEYMLAAFGLAATLPLALSHRHSRGLLAAAAGFVIGIGLSAPQWVPSAALARNAARRAQSLESATTWSVPPPVLAEVVWPFRFWELELSLAAVKDLLDMREPYLHSIHIGLPVIALALLGAASAGRAGRWGAGCLGLAVAWSLGRHAPFHGFAVTLLPPLGQVRYPVKAMVVAALACALLAGLGFDAWRSQERARLARALAGALALASLLLLVVAQRPPMAVAAWTATPERAAELLDPVARAAAQGALAGLVLVLLAGSGRRAAAAAVAGLTALAPLASHASLLRTAPVDLFRQRPELLRTLPKGARVYAYDYLQFEDWQLVTNPSAPAATALQRSPVGWERWAALMLSAYDSFHPPTAGRWGLSGSFDYDIARFDPEWLEALCRRLRAVEGDPAAHARLLRVGAVDYAVAVAPGRWWAGLEIVATSTGLMRAPVTLLRVPDSLPRAYAVAGVRVADGASALNALLDRSFDPRREVLLSEGPARPSRASAGHVRIADWRADRVRLETDLLEEGFVVLVDAWEPGWTATVDGQQAPVLRANVAFRAVPVPAGRHEVALRYVPPGLGAGISLGALAAAVLACLARARAARDAAT